MNSPGGPMIMSPLQVCQEGSNWEAVEEGRLLWCNILKNSRVRHTPTWPDQWVQGSKTEGAVDVAMVALWEAA